MNKRRLRLLHLLRLVIHQKYIRLLYITLGVFLLLCTCSANSGESNAMAKQQKDSILIERFWDTYDFTDTIRLSSSATTERMLVDYLSQLSELTEERACENIRRLVLKTKVNKVVNRWFLQRLEHHLYEPDSSLRNDSYYISVLEEALTSGHLDGMMRIRPLYQLKMLKKNRIGIKAADFTFILSTGELNFEKGKIALKTENYTENEAVKALIKKQMESFGKANNTFVKYFPSSTLMFFNVGVKGEGLYNLLSENKEFRNTVSIAKADEVKELFGSFNGDISAGLINVTMNSAPTFMMYADVKNGNALETIYKNKQSLGLKRGEDIMQLGKDEYVYKTKGMNIFFGIKDKQMYATNDELLYKNVGKAADKSIKDAPYASDMKGKTIFVAINAEAILDLPVVKMVAGFGGQEVKTYIELANKVSYLSMSSEGEISEIDLCLKDKDVNALKQIVDFAKQFAGM